MFKSFSHIVLSFLLLAATTGMAVSKHFCDEFLISTSFFSEDEPCCDSGNCCHNETTFYQVDEDFASPGFSQLPHIIDIDLFSSGFGQYIAVLPPEASTHFIPVRKPPPPPKIQTLLSLKQAFLL
ncbi:HYC_CC_PP family protein [Mariniphaga sp.]|uniref:HYC_CC_PP family protein n=1 Tax=Mariniphaga sp. TaxID=1954475 RepID=UPI003982DBF3